ncbi:MAG: hypothetical protein ABJB22_07045, partial [Verrucomicrobiota bacterium]
SETEGQLVQVNMKSSEGNLVFPNMLNEAFDSFSHTFDYADAAPTKPQLDVFQLLSTRLDEQLSKWSKIKTDDVPKVSSLIKQVDLPALSVSAKSEASPSPAASPPGG